MVDVRFVRISGTDVGACEAVLSDDELRRADTYRAEEDRVRFVAARAALRSALSEHRDVAPAAWRFETNEYGKPFVAGSALRFSVSHSGDLVAIAIAEGVEVGIDVEQLARGAEILRVAARFFTAEEQQELAAARDAELRAVELWTAKEALLKARGTGLHGTLAAASLEGVAVRRWTIDGGWLAALVVLSAAGDRSGGT